MKIPIALLLLPCASLTCAQTPSSRSRAELPQASEEKSAPAPAPARPELPKPELQLVSPVGLIDERVQKLHETVDLTAEQQKKIRAVLVKNDQAMQAAVAAFRADSSRETRRTLNVLIKAQNDEINTLLSDAQKTKGEAAQKALPDHRSISIPGQGVNVPSPEGMPAMPPSTRPPAETQPPPARK